VNVNHTCSNPSVMHSTAFEAVPAGQVVAAALCIEADVRQYTSCQHYSNMQHPAENAPWHVARAVIATCRLHQIILLTTLRLRAPECIQGIATGEAGNSSCLSCCSSKGSLPSLLHVLVFAEPSSLPLLSVMAVATDALQVPTGQPGKGQQQPAAVTRASCVEHAHQKTIL
jgi:hypothetical protein